MKISKLVILSIILSVIIMGKDLKIMTYNIYGPRLVNGEQIGEKVKKYNLDFVSLQEVDKNNLRSLGSDVTKVIAEKLGYNYYYFQKTRNFQMGEFGISIISKYPISEIKVYELPSLEDEKRQVIITKLDKNVYGKDIVIVNTHIDYRDEIKKAEIERLIEIVNNINADVKILSGDMNFMPNSEEYIKVTKNWEDTYNIMRTESLVQKDKINSRIDYIFGDKNKNWEMKESYFLDNKNEGWEKMSDHFPYISVFNIK